GMLCWLERLSLDASAGDREAVELAGAMADRFHKMLVRTLRALCDLRKVPLAVVVQNAGQVNVGGQQVNVARHPNGKTGDAQPGGDARHPHGMPGPCTCAADRGSLVGERV